MCSVSVNDENHDESLVDLLLILYTVENTLITRDKQKINRGSYFWLDFCTKRKKPCLRTTGICVVEPTLHNNS